MGGDRTGSVDYMHQRGAAELAEVAAVGVQRYTQTAAWDGKMSVLNDLVGMAVAEVD